MPTENEMDQVHYASLCAQARDRRDAYLESPEGRAELARERERAAREDAAIREARRLAHEQSEERRRARLAAAGATARTLDVPPQLTKRLRAAVRGLPEAEVTDAEESTLEDLDDEGLPYSGGCEDWILYALPTRSLLGCRDGDYTALYDLERLAADLRQEIETLPRIQAADGRAELP